MYGFRKYVQNILNFMIVVTLTKWDLLVGWHSGNAIDIGDARFESWSGYRLSSLRFFMFFHSPFRHIPKSSRFVSHPIAQRYIISVSKASLNST
jgi:hypothetical protein